MKNIGAKIAANVAASNKKKTETRKGMKAVILNPDPARLAYALSRIANNNHDNQRG